MASLTKTKAVFGITSPRTLEKIIPEIELLSNNFSGARWSGNQELQARFFEQLFHSEFYEGDSYPSDPALAARDRITRAPKALGFIDLQPTIQLTEIGKVLLSGKRIDETFTRQLLKFQLPSPYHTQSSKIKFNVKPYLELLRLIKDVGSLSKIEIALFFSQLTNIDQYTTIIKKINQFREDSKKFEGSYKTFVSLCFEREVMEIFAEEIENDDLKTRESEDDSLKNFIKTKGANMRDYADAFSRYIRATELVTFQKRTFRLIISPQKKDEVDYILKNIPRQPLEFKTNKDFKNYLFSPDSLKLFTDDRDLLIQKIEELGKTVIDKTIEIEVLKDILEELRLNIKAKIIEERKQELKDFKEFEQIKEVFEQIQNKEIPDPPLFLEWNVWRALVMLNYAKRIDGNFIMDIDGMPLNYAPGNKPDIESEFDDFAIITEVTMSGGNTQYNMEGESVPRHFGKAKESFGEELYCIFIAFKISEGTLVHYFNLNRINTKLYGGKTKIIPLSIEQFIDFVKVGVENGFNNPQQLREWLENQWIANQHSADELIWYNGIQESIFKWAS